jgi:nucleolar pre-ribosomal-associated protein 1
LETPHAATRKATESLLRQLLAPSIMFEHDPMEVDAWLSSMPKSPIGGAGSAPADIAERLHLLSFLDDCVRRCMKTPHRYMEDVIRLQAGETVLSASALPSPLLATVLEQLQAKIAGHIVSAEAARIIIRYIRQVILALSRKDISAAYLRRLAEKMLECLTKAEGARNTTLPELRQAAQLLKDELESLLGGFSGPQVTFREVPGKWRWFPWRSDGSLTRHVAIPFLQLCRRRKCDSISWISRSLKRVVSLARKTSPKSEQGATYPPRL